MNEELEKLKEQFRKAEPGSVEQSRIVENMERLRKIALEEEKAAASYEEMSSRIDNSERELEIKTEESKRNKFFKIIELSLTGGTFLLNLFTNKSMLDTILKFEKEDAFSSDATRNVSRNLISDIFRKKK